MNDATHPFREIGERVRLVRTASELGQAEFARRIGVKPTTYNMWETGRQRLSLDGALAIREKFLVPIDWLYCGGSVDMLPSRISTLVSGNPRVNHSR